MQLNESAMYCGQYGIFFPQWPIFSLYLLFASADSLLIAEGFMLVQLQLMTTDWEK